MVHIIGIDRKTPKGLKRYLGDRDDASLHGTGAVDHVAFFATGLAEMLARLQAAGVPCRERAVPGLGLHQVFVDDPNGVVVELNFPADEERRSPAAEASAARILVVGGSLGGLIAAAMLLRAGCDVRVLERSPVRSTAAAPASSPTTSCSGAAGMPALSSTRRWASGPERVCARPRRRGDRAPDFRQVLTSWGRLYACCCRRCRGALPARRSGRRAWSRTATA